MHMRYGDRVADYAGAEGVWGGTPVFWGREPEAAFKAAEGCLWRDRESSTGHGREHRIANKVTWVQTCCMILGQWLPFSWTHSSHLQNGCC